MYDVVVIGASSAGLLAAELLAKKGKKVILFERDQDLSPARRTYIITSEIYRFIPDLPTELIRHTISSIRVQTGEHLAEIQLNSPDIVIERNQLIKKMVISAEKAGVEVVYGGEFIGFDQSGSGTNLIIRINGVDTKIVTKNLIGADGVNSQVRSSSGLMQIEKVPLLQAEIQLSEDWKTDITTVWFDVNKTPYFFWLIPDQDNKAVVGLISFPGSDIRRLLDDFLENHQFKTLNYQVGVAALHSNTSKHEKMVGNVRVLLVGDAAGQVKVTTVGGTVSGFRGADAAARAILNGQSYRITLQQIQKELNTHLFIRQLLDNMTGRDYQLLIKYISPAVKSFLRRYNRDQMRRHFWKLVFLQPLLIPLGLKLLCRVIIKRNDGKYLANSD